MKGGADGRVYGLFRFLIFRLQQNVPIGKMDERKMGFFHGRIPHYTTKVVRFRRLIPTKYNKK